MDMPVGKKKKKKTWRIIHEGRIALGEIDQRQEDQCKWKVVSGEKMEYLQLRGGKQISGRTSPAFFFGRQESGAGGQTDSG
jgi:hypothetical protein